MSRAIAGLALFVTGCGGPVHDVWPDGCVGEPVPFLVIWLWGVFVPLLGLVRVGYVAFGHHRLARQADGQVAAGGHLAEGPVVLNGRVAKEEPDAAVRVEITQHGSEEQDSSGDWSFRWDEVDRRVFVRAFELELPTGERVRVEPDEEKVWLADALDGCIQINRAARKLVARLTPGEPVICVGRLQNRPVATGYRGHEDRWVLVPPRGREPMVLSTEPLGARFDRKVRGALMTIVFGLAVIVGAQIPAAGYHLRTWLGVTEIGTFVGSDRWTTVDDDGDRHSHRDLTVQLPGGRRFREEIGAFASVGDAYVRRVPGYPWASAFGRTPTAHWLVLLIAFAAPLLIGSAYAAWTRRAWYEGRKVNESGSGRLS